MEKYQRQNFLNASYVPDKTGTFLGMKRNSKPLSLATGSHIASKVNRCITSIPENTLAFDPGATRSECIVI